MNKENEKVVKIFQELKDELDTFKDYSPLNIWRSHVADLALKYLNPKSQLLQYISDKSIFSMSSHEESTRKGKIFMDNCISYISNNGIYKEPKKNFLSSMSDEAVIGLIAILVTTVFGAGYFCGNYFSQNKIDNEKIQMKEKLDSLQNLLPIPLSKTAILDTQIKSDSSKNAK